MHPALKALFDAHRTPQHATKRDAHDQLKPILTLASRVRQQLTVYREHQLNATLDAHDHRLDTKQEHLRSTIAGAENAVKNLLDAGEALANTMTQLERQMLEAEASITVWEKADAEPSNEPAPTVTLTREEHAHLLDRARLGETAAVLQARNGTATDVAE